SMTAAAAFSGACPALKGAAGASKAKQAGPARLLEGSRPATWAAASAASAAEAATMEATPAFAAAAAVPAPSTLSPLAAEVKGGVKNSSAPSAMMQTSALAAASALVPPQTPRTTATCGITPETLATAAFSFALAVRASKPSASLAPTEL